MMKFTILGSGTSVPHPKRSSSGYWVETESGSILLDCSASAVHRMAQENCDWANLDSIWISHFHLDHIGGLAPFLFGTKYAPETHSREKSLKIFGPRGLRKIIEGFDNANVYNLIKQMFPVEIIEIEPLEEFQILPDTKAVAFETPHTDESCAIYLRDSHDKTLVYSADTGFDKTLAAFAQKVDLFILECSFVKNKPVELHIELAEAMHLIRQAEPKKAILTHLYPEWDTVNFAEEVAKFSPNCEVLEAMDGLKIEI